MSNEQDEADVERFVDDVARSALGRQLIDAHLDEHPLPVDNAIMRAHARRLAARLQPPRPWWPIGPGTALLAAGLAAAAALALTPWPVSLGPVALHPAEAPRLDRAFVPEGPPRLAEPLPHRDIGWTVRAPPDTVVLTSEIDDVELFFNPQGPMWLEDKVIEPGTWMLMTQTPDGKPIAVSFPDGTAPPALEPEIWGERTGEALKEMRWESLPERTNERLDRLLDDLLQHEDRP